LPGAAAFQAVSNPTPVVYPTRILQPQTPPPSPKLQAAAKPPPGADKHLRFQFYRNPVEVLADGAGAVNGVRVEKTQLQTNESGAVVAVGTGEYESYPVQLVLKSIGYKSLPIEGVAFDARAGVIPNTAGRVLKGVRGLPGALGLGSVGACCGGGLNMGVDLPHGTSNQQAAHPHRPYLQSVAAVRWILASTCAAGSSGGPPG